MSLIGASRAPDGSEGDIDIALREALTNAVVHGNREDPNKHVEIICHCAADGAVDITIRDEGDGFDSSSVPDPTAAENRISTHGRGIYLMRSLMDDVRFEDRGTVVHMHKKPNSVNVCQASPAVGDAFDMRRTDKRHRLVACRAK